MRFLRFLKLSMFIFGGCNSSPSIWINSKLMDHIPDSVQFVVSNWEVESVEPSPNFRWHLKHSIRYICILFNLFKIDKLYIYIPIQKGSLYISKILLPLIYSLPLSPSGFLRSTWYPETSIYKWSICQLHNDSPNHGTNLNLWGCHFQQF